MEKSIFWEMEKVTEPVYRQLDEDDYEIIGYIED